MSDFLLLKFIGICFVVLLCALWVGSMGQWFWGLCSINPAGTTSNRIDSMTEMKNKRSWSCFFFNLVNFWFREFLPYQLSKCLYVPIVVMFLCAASCSGSLIRFNVRAFFVNFIRTDVELRQWFKIIEHFIADFYSIFATLL